MDLFKDILKKIDDPIKRNKVENMLSYIFDSFPDLEPKIGWNQPMFTHHGTYIIGFSFAKNHFSIGPEKAALRKFDKKAIELGYTLSKETIKVPWNLTLDLDFLSELIQFNINDKTDCTTFWRK